ncbi:MAG: UbiD family decarboxylase, partial [bacterium]|nr:UbiD family decarboxylase [bacterium]
DVDGAFAAAEQVIEATFRFPKYASTPIETYGVIAQYQAGSDTFGEAKNVLLAAFSGANEIKRVVVVDDDIDISDPADVEWAISNRVQPHRDLVVVEGALGSALDPSAATGGITSKWGIDATIPVGEDRSRYERLRTPKRAP